MLSLLRNGLVTGYLNHSMLVGTAWLRFLLFAFFLGALLALRDRVSGLEPLIGLAVAIGLYSGAVAMLIRRGRDDTARWIGGAFDTLTIMVALYLLGTSGAQNGAAQGLTRVPLFLAIPVSLVHFGMLAGLAVSVGVVGWYFLFFGAVAGSPDGMGILLFQAPAIFVISGLAAALSRNLQQQRRQAEQARLRLLNGHNGNGASMVQVVDVAPSSPTLEPLPVPERIRVYIAEESYLLKNAYEYVFRSEREVELVEICGSSTGDELVKAVQSLNPHVMLLGFNVLDRDAVEKIRTLQDNCPDVGLVVLCARFNARGLMALRTLCASISGACAYLLTNSVDAPEQLVEVVRSVAKGRVILDPPMMEALIAGSESAIGLVKELTPAEMKVLSWVAKGYNDEAISHVLGIEGKRLRKRIDGIYLKLGLSSDAVTARVHAATLYMKATGMLSPESRSAE